jgi:hypothetical protein
VVWQVVPSGRRYGDVAESAAELILEPAMGQQDFFRHEDPKGAASSGG